MKKYFDQFSTSYKQLIRTVILVPIIELIMAASGKLMGLLFVSIATVVIFCPFYFYMTIHDYKRLNKLKIEEPNPGLLTRLLVVEAIVWIACIIIIFLPIPSISEMFN